MKDLIICLSDKSKPLVNRVDFFNIYIDRKVEEGWSRNKIYILVMDLLNNYDLEEGITDQIYEFLTILIGDTAPASIFRLKGDPENDNDLANYVRSYIWRNADEKLELS